MVRTSQFSQFLCDQLLDDEGSANGMKLSLQSRAHFAHLMVDLIFKKWHGPSVFDGFYVTSSSCYSLVHIFSTSSSKKWKNPVSFLRFLFEIKLSLKSRAHFVDHFPDRGAQPRKQRPSSGDHGQPLTRKDTGLCARERFQP